jgi:ORF6N domain
LFGANKTFVRHFLNLLRGKKAAPGGSFWSAATRRRFQKARLVAPTNAVDRLPHSKKGARAEPNRLQLSLLSRSKPFIYHAPLNCAHGGLTMKDSSLIPVERIEKAIYLICGEKVMLDRDLADLYDVPTKAFNQAVKRHADRFPSDFMF